MQGPEKRTNQSKINLEDSLYMAISKLAENDQRTFGDMCHHILSLYVYGHGYKITGCAKACNCPNRES